MSDWQLDFTARGIVSAAIDTVRRPKKGADGILRLQLPAEILWMALAAVVAVSVLLGQGAIILASGGDVLDNAYLANPLVMWMLQLAVLAVTVYAIFRIGRAMGGDGHMAGALALIVWLQCILVCLQVVQSALLFVVPPLSDVLGIAGLVLFMWLLTNFIAVLHGFQSLGMVFVMILASAFGITFAFSILLSIIGVSIPGAMNV